MLTKKEAVKVIDVLEETYPDAKCALDYGTLYQLLVSVILSAQTTDVSVNKATPALFAAAPDAQSMVKLSEEELQDYIRSIGLYKNKSKSVLAMSRMLMDKFG
ncbi:MAG: endonuclease III, partial [Firmicutes bacterium]|nr:endonuclease III [Bacillota bacterium]